MLYELECFQVVSLRIQNKFLTINILLLITIINSLKAKDAVSIIKNNFSPNFDYRNDFLKIIIILLTIANLILKFQQWFEKNPINRLKGLPKY